MAKKKIEKVEKKKEVISSLETQVLKLTCECKAQAEDICELNKRIDRIVIAHNKCKSLKGL